MDESQTMSSHDKPLNNKFGKFIPHGTVQTEVSQVSIFMRDEMGTNYTHIRMSQMMYINM